MEHSTDSLIDLIDQLSKSLTKSLICTDIKEFSGIRNQFTRSCKDRLWGSLLNKEKEIDKLHDQT